MRELKMFTISILCANEMVSMAYDDHGIAAPVILVNSIFFFVL